MALGRMHDEAYRAVIKAFDDQEEFIKLKKMRFMSRFVRQLQDYKRQFEVLTQNKDDPSYLINLQQLCQAVNKDINRQEKLAKALFALAIAITVLAAIAATLMTFLVFPGVVCPSVACGIMMGSTLGVIFAGAAGGFSILGVSIHNDDKARVLNKVIDKLSLFAKPASETAQFSVGKHFRAPLIK